MAKLWLPHRHKARELSRKATIAEPSAEARRARDDFGYFGEYVLDIKPMPHHQVWIDALVTNQDSSQLKKVAGPNTAILAPRGSGKSSWYGAFVAWVLGHNPSLQVIYCSYSENVSLSRSRLIQRIIQSDKYRAVFPEILPGKRFSATDWEIDKTYVGVTDLSSDYSFLAVGAGGSITSKRCLVRGTIVETEIGGIPIEKFSSHIGIKVKTFNERSRQIEWRRVRALASRPANDIYEVRTSNGRSFRCTSDHPIYILGQGYTQTNHLTQGDTVVVTPQHQGYSKGMSGLSSSNAKEEPRAYLQNLLPPFQKNSVRDSVPWLQRDISINSCPVKRQTRQRDYPFLLHSSVSWQYKYQASLLQEMQCTNCRQSTLKSRQAILRSLQDFNQENKPITSNRLSILRNSLQKKIASHSVLLKGLRQQSPFSKDDGGRQQPFQERGKLHERVYRPSTSCFGTRQFCVRNLWERKSISDPSHQSQPYRQSVIELNNSLSDVPHETSPANNVWQTDTISSVTNLCGVEEQVYDIEVEGTHNFFANGVLVHNSKLIVVDDPVKSSESIENPEIREKLQTNWAEVLRPTLIPGGRVIAVGTRFRADDLFATTFTKDKGWHVIEQSAILEDPRTGSEVSYWPERYPIEELQALRESSPGSFSFQFQNRIIRISETSIDPAWIKRGTTPTDITKFDALALGLDLSATERETSDYSAFVLAGRVDNQFYILDARQGRWAGNIDKLKVLIDICLDWEILELDSLGKYFSPHGVPLYLHSEEVQYQASMAADFRHFMINEHKIYNIIYKGVKAKGSKLSRLRGVTGLFQSDLVTFNSFRAMGQLIDQATNFGSTDKDDLVDAMIYALMGVSQRAKLDVA